MSGIEYGRRQSRPRNAWIAAIVILALVGGTFLLLRGGNEGKSERGRMQAPIAVERAVRKDVPVYLNAIGTAQAYNTVIVKPQVEGKLLEIRFREGQDVKKGDVLAKIDPRPYKAVYDQAVANKAKNAALLENARRDLERYANLGDSIAAQAVDTQRATVRQLEAAVKADQAAVDSAATQLGFTTITAPISGRTGIRQVDAGNIVNPGEPNGLVVITQITPISVLFSLPQQHLPAINRATAENGKIPVLAVGEDQTRVIEEGGLELVDNQVDAATGAVRLKATFANESRNLWPGGFANVRMLIETRRDAIVIPASAVQRGPQNLSYVFVYKPETETVEMRNVTIALAEGAEAVVMEGVAEGESIVTDGMSKLQDGSKVRLAQAPATSEKPAP